MSADGGWGAMAWSKRWDGGRRFEGRGGELMLCLRMLVGKVRFMWAGIEGGIVGAISAPLRCRCQDERQHHVVE